MRWFSEKIYALPSQIKQSCFQQNNHLMAIMSKCGGRRVGGAGVERVVFKAHLSVEQTMRALFATSKERFSTSSNICERQGLSNKNVI